MSGRQYAAVCVHDSAFEAMDAHTVGEAGDDLDTDLIIPWPPIDREELVQLLRRVVAPWLSVDAIADQVLALVQA